MEWTLTHLWLILALVLGLAELTSGVLVLLALAVAAALTSIVSALGGSVTAQLAWMGVFSGILVPITIRYIRPWFSPRGVAYGTTGTGAEQGRIFIVTQRDFDGAAGIKVKGDFYRIEDLDTGATELPAGTRVSLERFEGTVALVHSQSSDRES
ncbi:membrane protein implicated in regulation of membrane protease activity [Tamilnaduibacter salinus]|uniref:Membrane protein implicated in regulation of membrane protease activity n=1 Tax=Tamilnaduibacter salinus TaxID=1484056 RepID=A0A2U1CX27_9GAMM|nr:nodulation efficiency, NfeD-like protein [Tamilnaduibacter salinus]PVY76804.1 membrane protein implicated in regulation of membrane protease activity [Tamilnaduibacter salinus]